MVCRLPDRSKCYSPPGIRTTRTVLLLALSGITARVPRPRPEPERWRRSGSASSPRFVVGIFPGRDPLLRVACVRHPQWRLHALDPAQPRSHQSRKQLSKSSTPSTHVGYVALHQEASHHKVVFERLAESRKVTASTVTLWLRQEIGFSSAPPRGGVGWGFFFLPFSSHQYVLPRKKHYRLFEKH